MPPLILNCPQCAMQLQLAQTMRPGTKVKCPKCAAMFETPNPGRPATPILPPVRGPNPAEAPTVDYEPRGGDGPHYRRHGGHPPELDFGGDGGSARGIEGLSGDYSIDLGEMFRMAGANWPTVVWPMIAYLGVLILISAPAAIPLLGAIYFLVLLVIGPALSSGLFIIPLHVLRGRMWTFNNFFDGFNWLVPIWIVTLLNALAGFVCALPGLLFMIAGIINQNWELAGTGFKVMFLGSLVHACINVRLFMFAPLLVVDRNCSPIEAIRGNLLLTQGHFWAWLGIEVLAGIIAFSGAIAFGIGIVLTIPFAILLMVAGYLQVTRRAGPAEYGPM